MPVTPTFPGVYIEEIPSGVHTIIGVATSITAFIGRTANGPTSDNADKTSRASTINSFADFERIYGGLSLSSTLGYAVRDFFLNGGSKAIIVRLFHPTFASENERTAAQQAAQDVANAATGNTAQDAAKAARAKADNVANTPNTPASVKKAADAVAQAAEKAAAVPGATVDMVKRAATRAVAKTSAADTTSFSFAGISLLAAYPGAEGQNLRTSVDFNTSSDMATALGVTPGDLFNLTVREDVPNGRVEQFHNLTLKDGAQRIDTILTAGSHLVRWDSSVKLEDAQKTLAAAYAKLVKAQDDLKGSPNDSAKQKALSDAQRQFEDDVSRAEDDLADAKQALAKARKSGDQTAIGKAQQAVQQAQTALEDATDSMLASDGSLLDEDDFTGPGRAAARTGLFALEQVDLFNILCIPPYLQSANGWDVDPTLISAAAAYCEQRRAMLLVDPPSSWTDKDTAKSQFMDASNDVIGTRSKNAALFFPRLRQPDPLRNDQFEVFVPCGAVAGVFARTDTQRGVWKAPAGLDATLVGVPQLSFYITNAENGELNPLGINCLRARSDAGRVIWGSRTLQGNDNLTSEWKYIPVRRLALFIEESLYRGTQWVVFEPNDEPLWAQIRLNVGAFMQDLFRQGAFQGQSPRDAYFVKCDKETTTQNHIDQGIVIIKVGFAPLKPAEFVIIQIQQMAGQVQA